MPISEQKLTSGSGKKQSATPAKSGGGKKGPKKDEDWEEVTRKYVQYIPVCSLFCTTRFLGTCVCVCVLLLPFHINTTNVLQS